MITGELKSQIDKVWEAFWTGAAPLEFGLGGNQEVEEMLRLRVS